jgi:hypothetical protein
MTSKFAERLKEYLDTECSDYSISYKWESDDENEKCEVEVQNDYNKDLKKYVNFKYDEEKDDLLIETSEDSYYETREYDWTVKYFWMLISPALFPEN